MNTALAQGLGQYGAIGLMLTVLLVTGLLVFRRLFDRLLTQFDKQSIIQDAQIEVSKEMMAKLGLIENKVDTQMRHMDEKQLQRHNDLLERLELRRTPIHGVPITPPKPRRQG